MKMVAREQMCKESMETRESRADKLDVSRGTREREIGRISREDS